MSLTTFALCMALGTFGLFTAVAAYIVLRFSTGALAAITGFYVVLAGTVWGILKIVSVALTYGGF